MKNSGSFGKIQGGLPVTSSSYQVAGPGFSSPMQYSGTLPSTGKVSEHDGGNTNEVLVFNLSCSHMIYEKGNIDTAMCSYFFPFEC